MNPRVPETECYGILMWYCCLSNSWSEKLLVCWCCCFCWAVVSRQDNVWQGRRNFAALHPASESDTETGGTVQEVPDVTGCYVYVCATATPLSCDFGHGYDSQRSLRCVRLLLDFSLLSHWETIQALYGHVSRILAEFPTERNSNAFCRHPHFSSYGNILEHTLSYIAFTKIFYYISHSITQFARHIFFISKAISTTQSNN